jgi:hypothetical protein
MDRPGFSVGEKSKYLFRKIKDKAVPVPTT